MLITLNNGKTVSMTWEKYDKMSDQEYRNFLDDESGEEINDPFFESQISTKKSKQMRDDDFSESFD